MMLYSIKDNLGVTLVAQTVTMFFVNIFQFDINIF